MPPVAKRSPLAGVLIAGFGRPASVWMLADAGFDELWPELFLTTRLAVKAPDVVYVWLVVGPDVVWVEPSPKSHW